MFAGERLRPLQRIAGEGVSGDGGEWDSGIGKRDPASVYPVQFAKLCGVSNAIVYRLQGDCEQWGRDSKSANKVLLHRIDSAIPLREKIPAWEKVIDPVEISE